MRMITSIQGKIIPFDHVPDKSGKHCGMFFTDRHKIKYLLLDIYPPCVRIDVHSFITTSML